MTRLPQSTHNGNPPPVQSPSVAPEHLFGTNLQLVDADAPAIPRRYPQRTHRAPVRYTDDGVT